MRARAGLPVVVSGPSGGGKTSVCAALLERRSDVAFSISATSRSPRPGEVDGRHYHFVSRSEFVRMVERGDLLEWAEVHGELYGTPAANLRSSTAGGKSLLLDIDVQGARLVRRAVDAAVLVFLLPPSVDSLLARLKGRGSEDSDAVSRRMGTALTELEAIEEFDYAVVNEEFSTTVDVVESILVAEQHGVRRFDRRPMDYAAELAAELRQTISVG